MKKKFNVIDAIELINDTVSILQNMRTDDEQINSEIAAIMQYAEKNHVLPEEDFCKHHHQQKALKKLDENSQTAINLDCKSFYRKEFKNLLDVLISDMEDNLKFTTEAILPIFDIFKFPLTTSISLQNVEKIVSMLPAPFSEKQPELIQTELELLFNRCKDCTTFDEILVASNKAKETLPNANIICRFVATIPISVASSERSFSILKLIKDFLRNRIGDERLDSCLMMYLEKELLDQVNFNSVLNKWKLLKNRRIKI